MIENYQLITELVEKYGSPFYLFNEKEFIENYHDLYNTFSKYYSKYNISYSLKTNYTPYIVSLVKKCGGYAEVVSGMEYYIAKKVGYDDNKIIFNGPNKGKDGIQAFLNGCILNVDNLKELSTLCEVAKEHSSKDFEIGIRVNIDVGQNFISRFGIDLEQVEEAVDMIKKVPNIKLIGLHCHISRCRDKEAWARRTDIMLALADKYFKQPPKYIDLGSGMFGKMDKEFAEQFDNIPTYQEYATVVAKKFAEHYKENMEESPILFTEPGTTLVNKYIDFVARVDCIKKIREKYFAVLDCSEHNLGETCTLKELPIRICKNGTQEVYEKLDFTGYTCLEQDVMRKDYSGELAVGDYVIFGNVGGYSNVLKPPFIKPNCQMLTIDRLGESKIIKRKESYDDILSTYEF